MKKRKQNKNTRSLLPIILISIGTLLVLSVLAVQLLRPSGTAQTPTQNANIPEPSVVRVSLQDSKRAYDAQTAVFLDVRSVESYQAGHIPGSINIPFDQLETRMAELDPNDWIITYCT